MDQADKKSLLSYGLTYGKQNESFPCFGAGEAGDAGPAALDPQLRHGSGPAGVGGFVVGTSGPPNEP
jgi:hypothetical protein